MAKKQKPKTSAKKRPAKAPTARTATKAKARSAKPSARKSASAEVATKYDQPGAPWWKKSALPMPKA